MPTKRSKKEVKPKAITDEDRRKRVRPLIDYWAKSLGLSRSHRVMFGFVDELGGDPYSEGSGSVTSMQVDNVAGPYRRMSITIKRDIVDHTDDFRLEYDLVHELLHMVFHPLSSEVIRLVGGFDTEVGKRISWTEETVVDHLAQVFICLPKEEE